MARRMRRKSASDIHHVMNRGVDRQIVFVGDRDRLDFGRGLGEMYERFGVETLAYCLMDNHYHLLLRAPGDALSTAMHHLGTTFTTRTNLRAGRDGPLFRGRFHSIPVETDRYLSWAARYIHRNPLDVTGVDDPTAYRWSSYRAYLGLRAAPTFLSTHLLLSLFDHDHRALAAFTQSDSTDVLGDEPSIVDLIQLIEFEIRRDDLAHSDRPTSGAWLTRSLLVLLASAASQHRVSRTIDAHLDHPSDAARQRALRKARSRYDSDAAFRRILGVLMTRLDREFAA